MLIAETNGLRIDQTPAGLSAVRTEPNRTPFWVCLWLGIALVIIKATSYDLPDEYSFRAVFYYLHHVILISGYDVLYALIIGVLAKTALTLARTPRVKRGIWIFVIGYCMFSTLYAVISVRIYGILRTPLTYPLLCMAGDLSNMHSSIGTFVTLPLVSALIGVPLGYLFLVMLSNRLFSHHSLRRIRVAHFSGILIALVWFQDAHHEIAGWDKSHEDYRLAENPHYMLAASCLNEMFGSSAVKLNETFPPECLADFQTVGEQPGSGQPTPGLARGPKNVIVVVCESVGTQHLSLYGSRFKTWPNMEAESANSLVFDNYYSHLTNTANSLYSLTLSSYPPLNWREYTSERPDAAGTTVAQVLKSNGYRTAFISAGYNEWADQDRFLAHRGYDVIKDAQDARRAGNEEVSSWGVEDRCMVDMILHFVDKKEQQDKPFYVFSWTQATHHPFEPGPNWENIDFLKGDRTYDTLTWDIARYLNALYELDKQLARLFAELRARKLADDTIVIVTGDHGEAFGWPHSDSVAHSCKCYQEDVNVPMFIWSPALFKSPERSQAYGGHVDLSPTVLDLLGIPSPPSWQGRSLLSPLHPPRAYFYGMREDYLLGVRENQYKYVFNATLGQDELYDVVKDKLEQNNIAAQHPDICKPMRQRLAAWVHYERDH